MLRTGSIRDYLWSSDIPPTGNRSEQDVEAVWLIAYGLILMIPVAPVAFYGSQVGGAYGLVATAYMIGLVAMLFAIFSYAALPVPLC